MPEHEQDENNEPAWVNAVTRVETRIEDLKNKFLDVERRDNEYKQRQLALGDQTVALAGKAVQFTAVLAFVGVLGGGICLYQSRIAKQTADAVIGAAGTIKQALTDGKQFFSQTVEQMTTLASAAKGDAAAARNAAEIATQSLAITERTSKAMQDQFRRDQRAWVGAKDIRGTDAITPQRPFRSVIQVENTGRSPGRDVFVNVGISAKMPTESDLDPPSASGKYVISPGGSYTTSIETKESLTDEEVSMLKQAVRTIYVFGTIHYLDSFGESRKTTFCAYYIPQETPALQWCDKYNRME
jgi:hypothetical protein